jgi:hypothetical protein
MAPKKKTPIKLGQGERLLEDGTYKLLAEGAPKEDSIPTGIKEYQFAVQQGFKGTYEQWDTARRKAGATSVSVGADNLGLKPKDRFDMEGKLGDDYRAATKTDNLVIGSAGQITELLKQTGPLKDQAAIYSFAKMLDTEGAVREADYAAIINTAGGIDRVKNLFNRALTGEMLTPNQREDMAKVARGMGRVAAERIRKQNKAYGAQAERYNLRPEAFLTEPPTFTDPPAAPAPGASSVRSQADAILSGGR